MSEHEIATAEVVSAEVTETAALRAFMPGKDQKIAGVKFYQFAAGRRMLLAITENEFYRARKHCDAFLATPAAKEWWTAWKPKRLASLAKALAAFGADDPNPRKAECAAAFANLTARECPKDYTDVIGEEFADLCEVAIPQFELHVGALTYLCTHDDDVLADVTVDLKTFRRAVVKFLNRLTTDQLTEITKETIRRYADENIGNNFEAEAVEGEPANPN